MRRKVLGLLILLVLSVSSVQPNVWAADGVGMFTKYYEDAQKFYNSGQYASAVTSYRQALRINYLDNSARIGLVNSYLALASYNANDEKNYEKASCALARPDYDGRRGPHRLRRLRLQQCGSLL